MSSLRLDVYLQAKYPSYSRSLIQKMIKAGNVSVDGVVETTTKQMVDDTVRIEIDTSVLQAPEIDLDLPVIYEDENCVVIDKPLGILVHSKGAYNPEATVETWLRQRPDYAFPMDSGRGGIVHRLDRATSGVMICAKNKETLGKMQKQFQIRKAKKSYIARVQGTPELKEAKIDVPIERNPKKPQTFRVGANGKEAQTEYTILEQFENGDCLLELRPRTGRTHQLRVHLHYIKHPIIGDTLYDGRKADRMYLHAHTLELTMASSERKIFTSPVPKAFNNPSV